MLTSAVGDASKLCLIVLFTVSGQAPCSGARRRDKVLDAVAENTEVIHLLSDKMLIGHMGRMAIRKA